jgi:hypothetical protein
MDLSVQAPVQHRAAPKERNILCLDGDGFTASRIAPELCLPRLGGEDTEAAQLDPIAPRHGDCYLIEKGRYDPVNLARGELRIEIGQTLDKLRLGHGGFYLKCVGGKHRCKPRRERQYRV